MKRLKAELRSMNTATVAGASAVAPPCEAMPRFDGTKRAVMKSEKCEKWVFVIFQSEPAVAQSVPTKMDEKDFSDFSKSFRGYTGGVERRNYESRIRKL